MSLMSLYRSNLFPTFFKPLHAIDLVPCNCKLRELLDVYNISSDEYILVFTKDVSCAEPYIAHTYLQVLLHIESA